MKHYLNLSLENIEGEYWKDLSCYIGIYQVSSMGRIKSIKKIDRNGKSYGEKILKPFITKNGYVRVCLSKDGEQKKFQVHRLIAQEFKPNPFNKPNVNHIQGIKYDNRESQLEWATRSEDEIHSFKVLGKIANKPWQGKKGRDNIFSKPVIQISKAGTELNSFESYRDAGDKTGVSISCIGECIRGTRKTAGGFIWKQKTI